MFISINFNIKKHPKVKHKINVKNAFYHFPCDKGFVVAKVQKLMQYIGTFSVMMTAFFVQGTQKSTAVFTDNRTNNFY